MCVRAPEQFVAKLFPSVIFFENVHGVFFFRHVRHEHGAAVAFCGLGAIMLLDCVGEFT